MNSKVITSDQRTKLKLAREHLCDILNVQIDNKTGQLKGVPPWSEEYHKIEEIVGLIEKLLGII